VLLKEIGKKSEDLITITHGVKDYGVKEINIKE
jgi:hypothetical protein